MIKDFIVQKVKKQTNDKLFIVFQLQFQQMQVHLHPVKEIKRLKIINHNYYNLQNHIPSPFQKITQCRKKPNVFLF